MAQKAQKLKGIIFDKDGTLFDYSQVWEEVLKEGIENAFHSMGKSEHLRAKQAMLKMIGIDEQGNCLPKGLVFTHRPLVIMRRFLLYCAKYRINALKAFRSYHYSVKHSEILLTEKLKKMDFTMQRTLFQALKQRGLKIGIITSDNASSTALFLSLMGLQPYVDFVASRDSHYRRKPHPQAFNEFCSKFSLEAHEVAMVGDTLTDMVFAKRAKAGYTIALLSGSNDSKRLTKFSDILYPDISYLSKDTLLFPGI